MKLFLSLFAASTLLISCSTDPDAASDAKGTIAGDKAQVVEVLKLADAKGTAGEAFIEAAQDSSLAAKMRAALGIDDESSAAKSSARRTTQRKDALDKAGDALDKANEKLEKTEKVVDKSGQVLDKAGDIKRKTGEIFK